MPNLWPPLSPQHFEVGDEVPGCSLSLGSWAISCRYQVAELRVVPRAGPLLFLLLGIVKHGFPHFLAWLGVGLGRRRCSCSWAGKMWPAPPQACRRNPLFLLLLLGQHFLEFVISDKIWKAEMRTGQEAEGRLGLLLS